MMTIFSQFEIVLFLKSLFIFHFDELSSFLLQVLHDRCACYFFPLCTTFTLFAALLVAFILLFLVSSSYDKSDFIRFEWVVA